MDINTDYSVEKAILVGLNSPVFDINENADDVTLDELEALLETAGGVCVGRVLQNKATPDPKTMIGEGKVQEVAQLAEDMEAELIIFDNDLTASQVKALEASTGKRIMDRSGLILDIFAQRAKTKEGRLQVELAQYKYLLPRLTGMWGHLVRQTASGGKSPIGTRGPGETQLETDRRHIRRKITALEKELEDVRRVRFVQRERRIRNEVPVVAIVGYTNAGKSTLLNKLTDAGIPANNRLFDTLDTTTRKVKVSDTLDVLMSDTVGFIRKLPHHLVEAFKATLEELTFADVLLHVVDISSPQWETQVRVVDQLIEQLGAAQTPRIEVYNKVDMVDADILPHGDNRVCISARSGQGLEELMDCIEKVLNAGKRQVKLLLPYSQAGQLDSLYKEATVLSADYTPEGIEVTAVCGAKHMGRLAEYIIG